jgi:hypothetical protein
MAYFVLKHYCHQSATYLAINPRSVPFALHYTHSFSHSGSFDSWGALFLFKYALEDAAAAAAAIAAVLYCCCCCCRLWLIVLLSSIDAFSRAQ